VDASFTTTECHHFFETTVANVLAENVIKVKFFDGEFPGYR
jgi:hypothetical protein